jgi:hypothetical protein
MQICHRNTAAETNCDAGSSTACPTAEASVRPTTATTPRLHGADWEYYESSSAGLAAGSSAATCSTPPAPGAAITHRPAHRLCSPLAPRTSPIRVRASCSLTWPSGIAYRPLRPGGANAQNRSLRWAGRGGDVGELKASGVLRRGRTHQRPFEIRSSPCGSAGGWTRWRDYGPRVSWTSWSSAAAQPGRAFSLRQRCAATAARSSRAPTSQVALAVARPSRFMAACGT